MDKARQAVGVRLQLRICQGLTFADERRRSGVFIRRLLEDLVQASKRRCRPRDDSVVVVIGSAHATVGPSPANFGY